MLLPDGPLTVLASLIGDPRDAARMGAVCTRWRSAVQRSFAVWEVDAVNYRFAKRTTPVVVAHLQHRGEPRSAHTVSVHVRMSPQIIHRAEPHPPPPQPPSPAQGLCAAPRRLWLCVSGTPPPDHRTPTRKALAAVLAALPAGPVQDIQLVIDAGEAAFVPSAVWTYLRRWSALSSTALRTLAVHVRDAGHRVRLWGDLTDALFGADERHRQPLPHVHTVSFVAHSCAMHRRHLGFWMHCLRSYLPALRSLRLELSSSNAWPKWTMALHPGGGPDLHPHPHFVLWPIARLDLSLRDMRRCEGWRIGGNAADLLAQPSLRHVRLDLSCNYLSTRCVTRLREAMFETGRPPFDTFELRLEFMRGGGDRISEPQGDAMRGLVLALACTVRDRFDLWLGGTGAWIAAVLFELQLVRQCANLLVHVTGGATDMLQHNPRLRYRWDAWPRTMSRGCDPTTLRTEVHIHDMQVAAASDKTPSEELADGIVALADEFHYRGRRPAVLDVRHNNIDDACLTHLVATLSQRTWFHRLEILDLRHNPAQTSPPQPQPGPATILRNGSYHHNNADYAPPSAKRRVGGRAPHTPRVTHGGALGCEGTQNGRDAVTLPIG